MLFYGGMPHFSPGFLPDKKLHYQIFFRYWDGAVSTFMISCDDKCGLYEFVGRKVLCTLERIDYVGYSEVKTNGTP